MNNAQRDLLAKALADISKGIFIGVLLAGATDKLFFYEARKVDNPDAEMACIRQEW